MCNRVRGPDTDEYKNMVRLMKYIQGTIGLPLNLPINKSGNITWYDDAVFALHKYIRSHTGGFMNMGTGGSYFQSRKQKLNTKISPESKLVGVDDFLTQVKWTRYFIK